MTEPTNLEVIRGKRKELCVYCGKEAHASILACPRVRRITVSEDGNVCDIYLREVWPDDDDPDLAG